MISLSILFSGRGSNALSILNNIVINKLNFKVKNVVCNKKDAP
jgi:folate-dependent phosphoribosylglycinamide formyltransferase PurN